MSSSQKVKLEKENRTLGLRWFDMLFTSVGREGSFGSQRPLRGWWSLFLLISRLRVSRLQRGGEWRAWEVYAAEASVRACEVGSWGAITGAASSYLCGRGQAVGGVRLLRPGEAEPLSRPNLPGWVTSHADLGEQPRVGEIGEASFLFQMSHSLSWSEVRCFPALVLMPRSCLSALGQSLFWLWDPALRGLWAFKERDLNEKKLQA